METIRFIFDETNEEVDFAIISSLEHNDVVYLMVVDELEIENDDMTAYILKATEIEGEEVIYEIVDDEDELEEIAILFEDILDNYEIDDDDE